MTPHLRITRAVLASSSCDLDKCNCGQSIEIVAHAGRYTVMKITMHLISHANRSTFVDQSKIPQKQWNNRIFSHV